MTTGALSHQSPPPRVSSYPTQFSFILHFTTFPHVVDKTPQNEISTKDLITHSLVDRTMSLPDL